MVDSLLNCCRFSLSLVTRNGVGFLFVGSRLYRYNVLLTTVGVGHI
jgi:hypothetical protein